MSNLTEGRTMGKPSKAVIDDLAFVAATGRHRVHARYETKKQVNAMMKNVFEGGAQKRVVAPEFTHLADSHRMVVTVRDHAAKGWRIMGIASRLHPGCVTLTKAGESKLLYRWVELDGSWVGDSEATEKWAKSTEESQ